MFELWNLAEQNSNLTGWIVGGAVFVIGSAWAIVHGIRNPESEYYAGLEFEVVPRTLFLIFCSFILAGMSLQGWRNVGLVILTLLIIGAARAIVVAYLDHREVKRNERAWHNPSRY